MEEKVKALNYFQRTTRALILFSAFVLSPLGHAQQTPSPNNLAQALPQNVAAGASPEAIQAANAIRAALQQDPQKQAPASEIPPNQSLQQLPVLASQGNSQTLSPPLVTVNQTAAQPAGDASALPSPEAIQKARDQAFDQMTLRALPMSPEQIQKLRDLFGASQRAATAYPGGSPPKPVASTQLVQLAPGTTPPIIRLAQGYVTSVVFLDSTGAPWPIQSYDIGNPGAFNIQWDHTSNILLIQSSALYTIGNLAVMLKGLNTPVMITLIPGQPIVDYRIDMRVQGVGPNATPGSYGVALPAAADNQLINVLDGVAPSNAKVLTIPGSNSQAWLVGNNIYLRTSLTLLSPAWIASMSSADGTNAYQIPKTPSILVGNSNGKIFNLRIEGY